LRALAEKSVGTRMRFISSKIYNENPKFHRARKLEARILAFTQV
jgi:hypothetical protein